MKKIEAIVKPFKLDDVRAALTAIGAEGMTVTDVRGIGRQPARTDVYEDALYTIDLLPKVKVEVVVPDKLVDRAVCAIRAAARTGAVGDGKIFVLPVDSAVRICTAEVGDAAV